MWEVLRTDTENLSAILIYAVIAAAIVAGIGIKAWHKNEAGKRDAEIKLEMLARGMSTDDIVRVLAAKSERTDLKETADYKKT
jgi:hypothetical protein